MGRFVYCNGETVWKYLVAAQDSEMHRIYTELGIGQSYSEWCPEDDCGEDGHECEPTGDSLTLYREDIEKLRNYLKSVNYDQLKEEWDDLPNRFEGMTEYGPEVGSDLYFAESDFLQKHPDFHFYRMIEAFIRYADQHPEEDDFYFDGEF